jgi:hypothetical protein
MRHVVPRQSSLDTYTTTTELIKKSRYGESYVRFAVRLGCAADNAFVIDQKTVTDEFVKCNGAAVFAFTTGDRMENLIIFIKRFVVEIFA